VRSVVVVTAHRFPHEEHVMARISLDVVAVENLRSRMNTALGLTSQGFKDHCEIPAREQAEAEVPAGEVPAG
jgi:hypothetical protein